MSGMLNTNDFELLKTDLTVADGTVYNIRFMILETNIYECVYNNQTTCDLLINDATNMIMNLPIFGFETLHLKFRTPGKAIFDKVFRLIRITHREALRERQIVYPLHFVTPEVITNLKTRVSKSYKGKLISDMVSDLHTNILKGGKIYVEPTIHQQHFIIPNIAPCHAINWLATRAVSGSYSGASYLYYQDANQFNFCTMESRMAQPTAKKYLYQVANIRKDVSGDFKPQTIDTNIKALDSYIFEHYSDILENLQAGMYGNTLITHSQARKLWSKYTFDYPSSWLNYQHLYQQNPPGKNDFLYSAKAGDLASPGSKLKLHSTGYDKDQYPFLPETWLPARISQLQQLQNIQMTMTIPGDSDRTVGQVIEIALPSPEPTVNHKQISDKYHTGRFLIQSLRHKIDPEKFTTTCALVKDSVTTALP